MHPTHASGTYDVTGSLVSNQLTELFSDPVPDISQLGGLDKDSFITFCHELRIVVITAKGHNRNPIRSLISRA